MCSVPGEHVLCLGIVGDHCLVATRGPVNITVGMDGTDEGELKSADIEVPAGQQGGGVHHGAVAGDQAAVPTCGIIGTGIRINQHQWSRRQTPWN